MFVVRNCLDLFAIRNCLRSPSAVSNYWSSSLDRKIVNVLTEDVLGSCDGILIFDTENPSKAPPRAKRRCKNSKQ